MKHKSNSQFAFSNPRFLIGLLLVLISVSLALVGSGAVSKAPGDARESMRSPQTAAAIANARPLSNDVTIRNNVHHQATIGNRLFSCGTDSGDLEMLKRALVHCKRGQPVK